jgi:hypothetical protein
LTGGKQYQLVGDYSGVNFAVTSAHAPGGSFAGMMVTAVPCYCAGTAILTDRGAVAVESLRIGDRLMVASGAARAIKWIGRRSYEGRFVAKNRDILPVCFAQGSLGDGLPLRDLYVSPLHAMMIDDVLIPARALVNGGSIRQMDVVERVEYFHLELATHDVILAEGAPSESYLDRDNRGMFQNAAEYWVEFPLFRPEKSCLPRVEDGVLVDVARARLVTVAAGLGLAAPLVVDVPLYAGVVSVKLPAEAAGLRLCANVRRQAGDCRALGALVAGVMVDGVRLELDDPAFGLGFYALEPHGARWTAGVASIELAAVEWERWCHIEVAVMAGGAAAVGAKAADA